MRDNILEPPLGFDAAGFVLGYDASANDHQRIKTQLRIHLLADNLFHIRSDARDVAASAGKYDTANLIERKRLSL